MNVPKNILSKEEFCEVIAQIKYYRQFENELYNVFNKFMCESPSFINCEGALVDTLNRMFNQKKNDYYGTDVEYFIYDLNFGQDWEPGDLKCNGKDIDISDAEKFYDWLIYNMDNGDENASEDEE